MWCLIYSNNAFLSAYCGGMWLVSLRMMVEMAKMLNIPEDQKYYQDMLDKGQPAFEEKVWNGKIGHV